MLQPFQNIKITEGNDFSLLFPLKTRVYVNGRPIDSDVDILALTDVVVKCGEMTMPCAQQADGLLVDFPDTLAKGTYDIVITAQYRGHELRAAYFEALTIVAWSYQSDAQAYMQGSPILVQPAFVVYNLTDAELAQLKQDLRDAIAAAEQAEAEAIAEKERYAEALEHLDDVAKQGSNPLATNTAILEAFGNIDFSTLAKEQTLTNGIQSILTALNPKATKDDVTAAKQAILDALSHISPEDPNSKALAEFFGLPEALPEIEVATEQEVKDINDDVMGALYGYGKVAVTIHSLMRTGAETIQDLASVIYVDPEKTWAENGYPTLYDDEGEPIDTTTNPAQGDEVFNYQIQSES